MKLNYDIDTTPEDIKQMRGESAKIIHDFVASGRDAAAVDFEGNGDISAAYTRLYITAARLDPRVRVMKRKGAVYLLRRDMGYGED